MKTAVDSKGLLVRQVSEHSKTLSKLLEAEAHAKVEDAFMEKCMVSTKMLANSMSLLSLNSWQELLSGYESLLMIYRNERRPWDERIAQITSELIEKEEILFTSYKAGENWKPASVVADEEIRAVLKEVNVLFEMNDSETGASCDDDSADVHTESNQSSEHQTQKQRKTADDAGECLDNESFKAEVEKHVPEHAEVKGTEEGKKTAQKPGSSFLANLIPQLDASCRSLLDDWNDWKAKLNNPSTFNLQKIKKEAQLLDFYALSINQIASFREKEAVQSALCSLEPIKTVLEDYATVLSDHYKRRVDIGFLGETNEMDVSLLFGATRIVQCMVDDICKRSDEEYLRIEVEVGNSNGALWWVLRDNGNNFITDSQLDREDFLAFYPGLREVKRLLKDFNGVLWVEPNEDHDKRFAFTMPVCTDKMSFNVWGENERFFAVPSTQICMIVKDGNADIQKDVRGENILVEGQSVPLVRLSLVSPDAPELGDEIVVAGSLEKRIAFYVQGDGNLEEGTWERNSRPIWQGLSCGTIEIEEERIPVIEVATLLRSYHDLVKNGYDGEASAGFVEDEVVSHKSTRAFAKEDESAQKEDYDVEHIDVVVLERSEAVREALMTVFSSRNMRVKMFDEVQEAEEFIRKTNPNLIVSEFRTPSMAAKALIERLRKEGRHNIPVFVTSAQDGEKAEDLIKELGASEYLLKPIDPSEVISKVGRYIHLDENLAS
jgi:CheY-like chemotaxis protein